MLQKLLSSLAIITAQCCLHKNVFIWYDEINQIWEGTTRVLKKLN